MTKVLTMVSAVLSAQGDDEVVVPPVEALLGTPVPNGRWPIQSLWRDHPRVDSSFAVRGAS